MRRSRLEVAQQMLTEARADVVQADQKATTLLAAIGIGFGAVLGGQLASSWDSSDLQPCAQVIWWTGVVLAVLSVGAAAAAVWPRYKSADVLNGITYWAHVAHFDDLPALSRALDREPVDSHVRTRHQLWRLSKVVRAKYRFVRAALALAGSAGLLLGLAAVIIR